MEQSPRAPDAYYCSITHEVMRDPVILTGTAQTYERASIERWLRDHRTDPMTNKVLNESGKVLIPNLGMRAAIEEWNFNAEKAKLGRIIPAHQLRNLKYEKMMAGDIYIRTYTIKFNDRDVLVVKYSSVRNSKFLVPEIMNKLMSGNHNHITSYLGCTKLDDGASQQGRQASAAANTDTSSSPNAVVIEQAPLGSLEQVLSHGMSQEKILSKKQIVEVLCQVAEGLAVVHANGIIYRNLTLSNIMVHQLYLLSPHYSNTTPVAAPVLVKLGGFHRAVFTNAVTETAEGTSIVRLTSGLIPPELLLQGRNEAAWTTPGDVWCFGIVIWKICSRTTAIVSTNDTFDYAFSLGLHEGINVLSKPQACSDSLWQLARRCLVKQSHERPSMQQVCDELRRLEGTIDRPVQNHIERSAVLLPVPNASAKRQREEDDIIDHLDPEAIFQRAKRHSNGDMASVVPLLFQAAEFDHAPSEYELGMCYKLGRGVPMNFDNAVLWFRRAIAHGSYAAGCSLGICYENGQGVPQDNTEAFKLFKAAADGNAEGQYHYARYLYDGIHCAKNVEQAIQLFRAAANNGCEEARQTIFHHTV